MRGSETPRRERRSRDHLLGAARYPRPRAPPEEYIPVSGSIFRDLRIHDFDILRWLTGAEVDEVYAAGGVCGFDLFARHGDVDTSAALITMQNSAIAVLTGAATTLWATPCAEIFGSRDSVAVGLDGRTPLRSVQPGIPRSEKPAYTNFRDRLLDAYRAEIEHFLSLVRGEAENPCTACDALEARKIALAADISLAEHRPVSLSEVG